MEVKTSLNIMNLVIIVEPSVLLQNLQVKLRQLTESLQSGQPDNSEWLLFTLSVHDITFLLVVRNREIVIFLAHLSRRLE